MANILTENFDGVTTPALPSGWTADTGVVSSTTRYLTGKSLYFPIGPHNVFPVVTLDGNNGNASVTARWNPRFNIAGTSFGNYVRLSNPTSLTGASYYRAAVSSAASGGGLSLIKSVAGTATTPVLIGTGSILTADIWYNLFISAETLDASTVRIIIRLQRLSDSKYLDSNATWQTGSQDAISYLDTASDRILGPGYSAFRANTTSGDEVYLENVSYDTVTVSTSLTGGSITPSNITSNSATISWTNASSGTAPYAMQLQQSLGGAGSWSDVSGATTSPANITGLNPGYEYDFRVRYIDSAGSPATAYSAVNSLRTLSVLATTPGPLKIVPGSSSVMYTRSAATALGLQYWPDGSIGIWDESGTIKSIAANSTGPTLTVGPLSALASTSRTSNPITSRKNTMDYCAGGPVLLSNGTRIMFYHAEVWPGGNATYFYSYIGVARQSGNNWIDCGWIVQPNKVYDAGATTSTELGGGAVVVKDGYVYVYFRDYTTSNVFLPLCVARASFTDLFTAVAGTNVPVFNKYYNGTWTELGLGGKSTCLIPIGDSNRWVDSAVHTTSGTIVLTMSTTTSLVVMQSNDGLSWSQRQTIVNENGPEIFYPTIYGSGAAQRECGNTADIYFTSSAAGGFNRWNDAEVKRNTLAVTKIVGNITGLTGVNNYAITNNSTQ